jgi:hypothetical protein
METAQGPRLVDVFFSIDDPRQQGKVRHDLVELLVVSVNAVKHITLNLIRLDPVKRKGGVKARRLIAATSDNYRAELLGLK